MSLIDSSYFVEDISVPNISGSHPAASVNLASLNRAILTYERDYLTRLLGPTLYDEFITDLAASEPWATGLRDELRDTTNLISPIAFYVWYYWMRRNATAITGSGAAEAKHENATTVSPAVDMCEAYNKAMRMTWDVIDYLNEHADDLPSARVTESNWLHPINPFGI